MKKFRYLPGLLIGLSLIALLFFYAFGPASAAPAAARPQQAVERAWQLASQVGEFDYSTRVQPTARQQVTQAIEQAGDSGQYRYESTIVQTYHPTLLLENVGRTTRVETHQINGEVNVPADSMTLRIRAAKNPAMQIKIENGYGYGRFSEEDVWTEVKLATDLFAPGGDPMGFLTAAENVQVVEGPLANSTFPA
ncbi:MAG: hypothetical protein PVJ75_07145, partial [Chloroflexota bacterium]